jgi:hypothetical protein
MESGAKAFLGKVRAHKGFGAGAGGGSMNRLTDPALIWRLMGGLSFPSVIATILTASDIDARHCILLIFHPSVKLGRYADVANFPNLHPLASRRMGKL